MPVAIETFGSWGTSAKKLIQDVGKKLCEVTKEERSTTYLKQRISVAIQKGNAAAILGTIPSEESLDDIYYLI